MEKVRWGVLSTAKIGVEKVIPALQKSTSCEVVALASRDGGRARSAADRLGIPFSYGSYQELLQDARVEAVYNPLPNHLHVPWSIRALRAGKHVLCEKPIGLSSGEGGELIQEAQRHPRLKVMEAFMYRHHPQWRLALKLVKEKEIGDLRTIQSFFSYFNDDPKNIRNNSAMGGGGMFDIGCYSVSLSRFLFESEPRRVLGIVETDARFGVDRMASAILDFGRGTSTFTCGTQLAPHQRVNILGDRGRVEIEIPFNAPPDRPCRVWVQRGQSVDEIILDTCDQYTIQGDLFARSIREDSPVPTPLGDAVENMRVIEAVLSSGRRGGWIELQ